MAKLFGFIPGLTFDVSLNKEEFTEGCAQAVGARAYASTKQLTGKAYDGGERVVEAGAEAKQLAGKTAAKCKAQAIKAVISGKDESSKLLSAAISEVTDLSKDVAGETSRRAIATVDETVGKPVKSKIRSISKAGQDMRSEAHRKVNEYCGVPMKSAAEAVSVTIPVEVTPSAKTAPTKKRSLSDLLVEEAAR